MKSTFALIWHLFVRDFKAEYRQSLLGYAWAFIPVLATTLTWVFLDQQNIISIGSTDLPYPIHVMLGSMLWGVFAKSLTGIMQGFSSGSSVFVKIRCSPIAFSLSGLSQVFFDMCLQCLLLIQLLLLLFHRPASVHPVQQIRTWSSKALVRKCNFGNEVSTLWNFWTCYAGKCFWLALDPIRFSLQ